MSVGDVTWYALKENRQDFEDKIKGYECSYNQIPEILLNFLNKFAVYVAKIHHYKMLSVKYDRSWKAIDNLKNGAILNGGVGSGKSRTALAFYFCKV